MSLLEYFRHFPMLIFFILAIPIIILDIWAVYDISKHPYKLRDKKWAWTNVVLLFPLFGVFVYIFYGKNFSGSSQAKTSIFNLA
ncbi:PLDc N-terminal domain-containing protein [Daejeonella lutea]|uniref:Phospholipase_D-nuclease N-terminal n=1 Tax=Daejeonella lutea TaxID=572036 RepID=A0A1T5BIQ5_9SPHI|nr:PLD nuclease N-terminal domain-containing protein [Daejeonella lutea]SKB46957.1 Phospholipase_D-nuclease N-terminal [Daejeonella lutea]